MLLQPLRLLVHRSHFPTPLRRQLVQPRYRVLTVFGLPQRQEPALQQVARAVFRRPMDKLFGQRLLAVEEVLVPIATERLNQMSLVTC
jgi:hypothetical protein